MIDTSNFYPFRDDRMEAREAGEVESLWVSGQLDRSVTKAWNAIGSASVVRKGLPAQVKVCFQLCHDRQRTPAWGSSPAIAGGYQALDFNH